MLDLKGSRQLVPGNGEGFMGSREKKVGRWGEDLAADFLQGKGYSVLDRNVHSIYGEIDLVTRLDTGQESFLVFVEVKTRTSLRFGYPEQAVSDRKLEHLHQAIAHYLQQHPELTLSWQLDVIAIRQLDQETEPEIRHFENVI